jgi:transposase
MPKKTKVPSEVLQKAMEAARKAKAADELRAAQAVIFPGLLGVCDRTTGELLGRSRGSVVRMRNQFSQLHSRKEPVDRNWGGRRYGYMSMDQERQFLSRFFDQASQGGAVNAGEIKRAFEALVGHKVAKTTIYRMLDRHGWRKIMPRPHHPKSDAKAQKGFKKTAQNGDPMR